VFEQGDRTIDETPYNHLVLDAELRASGRYKVELDHFCECVLTGSSPLTSGEDGRKTIEAISAVYVSAYTGEKITLPMHVSPDFERLFAEMKARSPRFAPESVQ
jgi:predicted dehydrogenase